MCLNIKSYGVILGLLFWIAGIAGAQPKRIITLSGAISETVNALGLGKRIVAVDVTSTYPDAIGNLPKVSRNRALSLESILFFPPDLIIAPYGDLSKENLSQFKSLGVRVVQIKQEYSVNGAIKFMRQIAEVTATVDKGEALVNSVSQNIKKAIAAAKKGKKVPKVLFIYARGTGTMSVAGKGSNMDAIITLAGGKNAIQEFNEFKPYTTEALVKANPDVILMFDFGASSLGGKNAILKMPGVKYTNAGKNGKIIEVDGSLMINFSTRLAEGITILNEKIN